MQTGDGFSANLLEKAYFIAKMSGSAMIQLASSDFWQVPLVSSPYSSYCSTLLLLMPTAVASYYPYPFFLFLSPVILSPLLLLSPDILPPTSMLYCTRNTVVFCV